MSLQRQYQSAAQFGDTTYTKIFVGGLAWETQRDTMRSYFEQFGEILEAVVIADKSTGRSKGYGFVTFRDPDSAMRACQDPSPVIDGRRANCNLASLGAQKNRPPTPPNVMENYRPRSWPVAPANYRQSSPRIPYPYSPYGYSGYPQNMHSMNYYNAISGQQFSSPYAASAAAAATPSGSPGVYYNYYPYYAQFGQSGIHYPQAVQYPYLPQQSHGAGGSFSVPASGATMIGSSGSHRGSVSDQKSSA